MAKLTRVRTLGMALVALGALGFVVVVLSWPRTAAIVPAKTEATTPKKKETYENEEAALKALIARVNNFHYIQYMGEPSKVWRVGIFGGPPRREKDIFKYPPFQQDYLPPLAAITSIDSLVIDDIDVSGVDFRPLSRLKRLKFLEICCGLQDLAFLDGLDNLQELAIPASRLQPGQGKHLAFLKNLRKLDLRLNSKFNDADLQFLTGLRHLHTLRVSHISDKGLAHLGKIHSLESLDISWCFASVESDEISDEGLAQLAGLHQLREINLFQCPIKGTGLAHLKAAANRLEKISLYWTDVENCDFVPLFPRLKELVLTKTLITDKAASNIKGLFQLEILKLDNCEDVSDLGVQGIFDSRTMKHLDLSGTKVSDVTLLKAGRLSKLEVLRLHNVPAITDAGLTNLPKLKNLRELWLDGNITDAGMKFFTGLKSLERLYLRSPKLTNKALNQLKKALPNTTISEPG